MVVVSAHQVPGAAQDGPSVLRRPTWGPWWAPPYLPLGLGREAPCLLAADWEGRMRFPKSQFPKFRFSQGYYTLCKNLTDEVPVSRWHVRQVPVPLHPELCWESCATVRGRGSPPELSACTPGHFPGGRCGSASG